MKIIELLKRKAKQDTIIVIFHQRLCCFWKWLKELKAKLKYLQIRTGIFIKQLMVRFRVVDESVLSHESIAKSLGMSTLPGSSKHQGWAYHELPFSDILVPTHRKNLKNRVALIKAHCDIQGKTGIDLGCSVGGFVFSLQLAGAKMTGYDYDAISIEFARRVEGAKRTGAQFRCEIINKTILEEIDSVDFCIWFSQFMWLVKAAGREGALDFMFQLSKQINEVMFFETSIGDAGAGDVMKEMGVTTAGAVENLLISNTCFQAIECIGTAEDGWAERPIFKCSKPQFVWDGFSGKIVRVSRDIVEKTYHTKSDIHGDVTRCLNYERNALARLKSPYFPRVFEPSGNSVLRMEYAGVPLTRKNIPPNYEAQTVEILEQLRAAGIVHRDINPSNLLIKDEIIRLIDFGWAVVKGSEVNDLPRKLGGKYKAENGFDDEYSLRKSIGAILADKV